MARLCGWLGIARQPYALSGKLLPCGTGDGPTLLVHPAIHLLIGEQASVPKALPPCLHGVA